MKADDILQVLIDTNPENTIWATELAFSSGRSRCDYWTLHPFASKGYRATAYEIKISRADFKRDSHKKQREARLFSDVFYYVTPPGLLSLADVPDWAGLIEIHSGKRKVIHAGPVRDKDMPSWELVISLIRNSGLIRRDIEPREQELRALRRTVKAAAEKLKAEGKSPWQYGIHQH